MLKVVSKKVTTDKSPKMVFGLRMRVMRIGLFPHVRKISSKIKELQGRKPSRNHPKEDQIFGGKDELE